LETFVTRNRFLLKSFGNNPDGTREGLKCFHKRLQPNQTGVIVVPTLKNVSDTILVDVLGEEPSRQLIKDRQITLRDGATIHLCSINTLTKFKYADAYLALWAENHTIDAIEALPSWSVFTVVTWRASDADSWISDHEINVIFDDKKG
jgi:hypothetical protein